MTDFILGDNEQVTLSITPVDAAGNPAGSFDAGSVTATFPESSNLSAVVSADQTSVLVTALGPLATDDVLTIAGDVNGLAISVQFPIDVDASPAVAIGVVAGPPQDKPVVNTTPSEANPTNAPTTVVATPASTDAVGGTDIAPAS
jgi:hypothetical protein